MDGGTRLWSTVPVLSVADLRRATAFYEQRLGFAAAMSTDGYTIVRHNDVEIHMERVSNRVSNHDPRTACGIRIRLEGIAPLYEACSAAGIVHPRALLATTPWGTREFAVTDPDGYLITFVEPLPVGET